jgi:hypothetical protein
MVVRTEPELITNVEPNYLAFIEFYDELPRRYTPPNPKATNCDPGYSLLVLKGRRIGATIAGCRCRSLRSKPKRVAAVGRNSFRARPY